MIFGTVRPQKSVPVLSKKDTFISNYKINSGYVVSKQQDSLHYHNYFQVWYTVAGSYKHIINGKTYDCTPGSVALVMPFASHALNTMETDVENALIVSLSFPSNVFYDKKIPVVPLTYESMSYDGVLFPTFIKLEGENKSAADMLITDIVFEYRKKSDMFVTSVFNKTNEFFEILKNTQRRKITKKRLEAYMHCNSCIYNVVDKIENEYNTKLSIDDAAAECVMSRKAFTNNFRRITGFSYHEVIVGKRLMAAVDLMRFSRKSMAEIAEESGFSSSAHFSKACRDVFGVSPKELQRSMIENARKEADMLIEEDKDSEWARTIPLETIKEHRKNSLGEKAW